jgi:iron complex transport system ATP-binding protein
MMKATDITLLLSDRTILKDVHLQIAPGKFTAVVGANGAGKSSLLKVLSREYTKHSGSISINNKPADTFSPAALALQRAVLAQHTVVQFPFTVGHIVVMGRYHHRSSKTENKKVLEEVMQATGVDAWYERNYLTLSGGEKQRVQLARVMAQVWDVKDHARFILLDEPTSSLDIAQQQMLFHVVKQACARNIGVLAIVHDLNQAVQFADQLYFLKDGGVLAHGKPLDVFTKPIIEETFCCRVNVYHDPCTNCPYIVPDKNSYSTSNLSTSLNL